MAYIKIILSVPLLIIGLLGLLITLTSHFDIYSLILALIFLAPGCLLASNGLKDLKARKTASQLHASTISQVNTNETDKVKAEPVKQPEPEIMEQKASIYSDKEVLEYVQSLSGFPDTDDKGMKILKILNDVKLSGVTKEYEGVNPQDTIEMLSEGEEVYFKRIPMKKYPNAILVVDCADNPIGWIPEDFYYQEDIAKRLDEGTTVKGRVSAILGGENGKSYGVRIDIARYEKKRTKEEKEK